MTAIGEHSLRLPIAAAPEFSAASRLASGASDGWRLIEALATPIALCDARLRVVYANPVLTETLCERRLLGLKLADLDASSSVLPSLATRVREDGQRMVARRLLLELKPGHPRRFDVAIGPLQAHGDAVLLIEFHPLVEHDQDLGEGVVSSPQPVVQQMARALAHEIKNPLAGLRGAAQLLEDELPTRALAEYTEVIRHEADRIRRLVDRLLQAPEVALGQPFNVHEVIERVRTLIEAEAGKRVRVLRDYDPSLPDLNGQPDRLLQAILNLARNALQSGASEIKLRTRAERRARIGDRTCKLALRIDVCDNGRGVPEELRESLFLPYVTGRDEGTGLGLPMALTIAREHGGTLAFVSRPGATVFSLLLPVRA